MPRAAWPGPPLSLCPGQGGRAPTHERALPEALSPCSGPRVSRDFCRPWGPSWRREAPYPWLRRQGAWAADCASVISVRLCLRGLPGGRARVQATSGGKGLTFLYSLSAQNRGRLADKRTVALPSAQVLKKELTPSFLASDGDSDGSGPACGQRPGLKQEDDTHVRIMKRRCFPRARAWRARGLRCRRGRQADWSAGSWRQVWA